MAGIKHHHLPRFLQTGFTTPSAGRGRTTWVFKRNLAPYQASIFDSGAARWFYSVDGDSTLDEAMTTLESQLGMAVTNARHAPAGPLQDAMLPVLIAHLEVRSSVIRSMFADSVSEALSAMDFDSLMPALIREALPRLTKFLRDPEIVGRISSQLGVDLGESDDALLSFCLDLGFAETRTKFESLRTSSNIEIQTKAAHVRALTASLSPDARSEMYAELKFTIRDIEPDPMILGDSAVVFFVDSAKQCTPFLDKSDRLLAVVLPIGSTRILVGSYEAFDITPSVLREAIAECSYEFFVAGRRSPENEALAAKIGKKAILLPPEQAREIASEVLAEARQGTGVQAPK